MAKPARPRGRPPADKPKAAFRYSVNYNADENAEIEGAATEAGDAFAGRWVGEKALAWARRYGWTIWVAPADPDFEAAVQAHFPGYPVKSDVALEIGKREIRIGDGPVIPQSAHGIKPSLRQSGLQSIAETNAARRRR